MILLRSLAFQAAFIGWTLLLGPFFVPLMLLPRRSFARLCAVWARGALAIARVVAGIRYELRGQETLPAGPVILASKHQSAYETMLLYVLFPDCCYVLKRELFRLPFVGWFLWRIGMVGIDRGGKARAMIAMLNRVRDRAAAGRSIVIFPQGTRTAPGASAKYLPGVAGIYQSAGVPAVPVALNSGLVWPRNSFIRRPGVVTVQFLPAIEPGLDRRDVLRRLEAAIEPATAALEAEGRAAMASRM